MIKAIQENIRKALGLPGIEECGSSFGRWMERTLKYGGLAGFPYTAGVVAAVSVLYQPASGWRQRAGNGIGIGIVPFGNDIGKL